MGVKDLTATPTVCCSIGLVIAGCCVAPTATAQTALQNLSADLANLGRQVGPSVVQVITSGYTPSDSIPVGSTVAAQRGLGSGVIVSSDGYILTNDHVINGASRIRVALAARIDQSGARSSVLKHKPALLSAELVGQDAETDLAVLKINETDLPALEFADSEEVRVGHIVMAFGSPLALDNSGTMGVVSAVARQLEPDSPMVYVQTDTAINPGNSGGPLVNTEGRIVGINTLIFSQSGGNEGVGFAAPSNIAKAVYEQIRDTGSVLRGEIGVSPQTITPSLAAGMQLDRDWGVILGDVTPHSSAAIAGLKPGDIVASLDGKVMENGRQFRVNLYQKAINEVVTLEILRGGESKTVRVAVLERNDDPSRLGPLVNKGNHVIAQLGILGLDLTPEVVKMLPPLRAYSGVVVAARLAGGSPSNTEFQPGDLIHSVNLKRVSNMEDIRDHLSLIKPGGVAVIQRERLGELSYVTVLVD